MTPPSKKRVWDRPNESELPDLLHLQPQLLIDVEKARPLIEFAFAGGDVASAIYALEIPAAQSLSTFTPECFAEDLFLKSFIENISVMLDGWTVPLNTAHLKAVLSQPPPAQVADFRRAILDDLVQTPARKEQLENLYLGLSRLRNTVAKIGSEDRDIARHRIEALQTFKETIESMKGCFEDSDSGLNRIGACAKEIEASPGYQRLLELLNFENDMASVKLQLHVGVDGTVRHFRVLDVQEKVDSPFYASWFGRLLGRMMLWLRGHRVRDSELVERWIDEVFQGVARHIPSLIQLIAQIEFYLAALSFKQSCEQRGLQVCFPTTSSEALSLKQLFNPLLFSQKITPIPCDLQLSAEQRISIVTGPNSGGKTRLLQAVGLAQLLGQAGFYVPAAEACMEAASSMFVSVIEDARVDQQEGRLGTELLRIRRLFEQARPGALVVLDELCSGTNPSEGEEIFMLVISLLLELRPRVFITTHFLEFARKLCEQPEMASALAFLQVDLDEADRPTYQFKPGVAQTSLAAQTAARLGVTKDELMALIHRQPKT